MICHCSQCGDGAVPRSFISKPESKESRWCSSSPDADMLTPQGEPVVRVTSEGTKRAMSQRQQPGRDSSLLLVGRRAFLFYNQVFT